MPDHPALVGLDPGAIRAQASADGHMLVITDDLIRVGSHDRLALEVPIDNIRRIQFDIERDRPATLVIVPVSPIDEPQVVVVQPHEYASVSAALVVVGLQMSDPRHSHDS